ncbi:MAG TPA: DUF2267 domain-containing protein [Gaiellaceae bacterium]|nr:DUF2267 domain-containing protein [Gaiellaceae bacterium]
MSRESKAREDRHIGFRWLRWAARLEDEAAAEAVFRAVAAQVARRVGRDEAGHLRAHLPLGLRDVWDEEAAGARRRPEATGRDEFVAQVRARLGLESDEHAEVLTSIVFSWLRHLVPEERHDVAAVLPPGLRELWERSRLEVPPWSRLHLPRSAGRRVRATFIAPEETFEEELFDLPEDGSLWWHGTRPYRVERVERRNGPAVTLADDPAARAACPLPAGYTLGAWRRAEEGLWVAEVRDAEGRSVAWWEHEDCLAAVEEAHAIAVRSLELAGGFHPEREV